MSDRIVEGDMAHPDSEPCPSDCTHWTMSGYCQRYQTNLRCIAIWVSARCPQCLSDEAAGVPRITAAEALAMADTMARYRLCVAPCDWHPADPWHVWDYQSGMARRSHGPTAPAAVAAWVERYAGEGGADRG